jgi:hypothetical protein
MPEFMMQTVVAGCRFALVGLLLCSVLLFGSSAGAQIARDRSVEVQMRNVVYHYTNAVAVQIRRLHGQLLPTGEFPIFDDKNSFSLQIQAAEIAVSVESLANVLNSYVFARDDAPLKQVFVRIENKQVKIKGKLHKKGNIPFETAGEITVTADGKLRLHADNIKAAHLPVKGIMDALGLEIADLIKTGKVAGVEVEKDDLILDPSQVFPPPHITGQVTQVRLDGDRIVQVFGVAGETLPMRVAAANYMAYRGNRLRFGKLSMNDTDLVLIDMDPQDPFDFYLDHYKEQLVAGYTKETFSFGLRFFMRDYNKLRRTHLRAFGK